MTSKTVLLNSVIVLLFNTVLAQYKLRKWRKINIVCWQSFQQFFISSLSLLFSGIHTGLPQKRSTVSTMHEKICWGFEAILNTWHKRIGYSTNWANSHWGSNCFGKCARTRCQYNSPWCQSLWPLKFHPEEIRVRFSHFHYLDVINFLYTFFFF